MKVLVVYYSETSNTENIAKSIYEEVSKEHETKLRHLEDIKVENLQGYDIIFAGTTCHDSDLAKPMKKFLETIPENSSFSLAGFYTHAAYRRDDKRFKRAEEIFNEWAAKGLRSYERGCQEKGIEYKGHFNCMGAPNPGIEIFIKHAIIQDEDEWALYLEEVKKHPSPEDMENAKLFARNVLAPK